MKHASAVALTAALFLTGCGSDPPGPPRGPPVLLQVHWMAGPTRTLVFPRDADAGPISLPGAVSKIDFVFDRRLDGTRVEDTVNGRPVTKPTPPITVSWPDFANVMSAPPFSADVFYNSLAEYGGQTSYVFVRPVLPGFPSDTTVTFHLDRNALTSAYGEPMEGPEQIDVPIGPMTVRRPTTSTADALETVPPTFMFHVDFDNRPAPSAELTPFTRVTANGAPVPFTLASDSRILTSIYVSPATCLTGWPAGAIVDVTFEAGLPDAFGVGTTTAQHAGSFLVSGSTNDGGISDAGCD